MALRKRRLIRADLSAMPLLEQPLAAMHVRADQLKKGDYLFTDMHKGVVFSSVLHISQSYRIDYYNLDGEAAIAVYEAGDIVPITPWPEDRSRNNAILAYHLHPNGPSATQAPPAPISSPSGAPMPPIMVRADSVQPGDTIMLGAGPVVITHIDEFLTSNGEPILGLYFLNMVDQPVRRDRYRDDMVEMVNKASPMAYYVYMPIKIDGVNGYITSVSDAGTPGRLLIRWISEYINSFTSQQTAEFEVNGVFGNAP